MASSNQSGNTNFRNGGGEAAANIASVFRRERVLSAEVSSVVVRRETSAIHPFFFGLLKIRTSNSCFDFVSECYGYRAFNWAILEASSSVDLSGFL
jgi:hypothetical protein